MQLAHSAELCQRYPAGSNQHGEGHWPLLKILVAHDLQAGRAMRPEWEPIHGSEAVSEQELLERAIERLPAESVVIGNAGVFSVAWAATEKHYPIPLRLTAARCPKTGWRCIA